MMPALRSRLPLTGPWVGLLAIAGGAVAGAGLAMAATRLSPLLALGAVVGMLGFGVLVREPGLGLVLTAALVPIERIGRLTNDSTMYTVSLMRIGGVAALGALLLNRLLTKRGFVTGKPLLAYAIFVGCSIVSIAYSDDFVKSVQMSLTFLGNLMFFFVVINTARNRRLLNAGVIAWLLATVGSGAYATYDWHFGSGQSGGFTREEGVDAGRGRTTDDRLSAVWEDNAEQESLGVSVRRSMGPTSHAAVFGINLIMSLPFFLYAMRLTRPWWAQAGIGLAAAFVGYNILLTNTRGVIVTAALVAVFCVAFGLVRLSVPKILLGVACLAVLPFVIPMDTYVRSLDLSQYFSSRSATLRLRMDYWQAGLAIIRDHWLTGLGSGNERAVMKYVKGDYGEASNLHNEYLQTTMEVGVFPALVFFGFVGMMLRDAFRAARAFDRAEMGSDEAYFLRAAQVMMISVLIYGLQVDVFHFPLKGWWLVAGLVCVLARVAPQPASQAADGDAGSAGQRLAGAA